MTFWFSFPKAISLNYTLRSNYWLKEINWNWTRNHKHLVHKPTLKHLAKLASLSKWLSVRLWTKWLWFESSCSHLNFRFRACFEQGVPLHSWHDKNIQSDKPELNGNIYNHPFLQNDISYCNIIFVLLE